MTPARPYVRVHAVAIDSDRRLLLDRISGSGPWTLPWAQLSTGEDPVNVASGLVRATGADTVLPRIVGVASTVENGDHVLDLTFHCSARRVWTAAPGLSGALWWSLDEISSLDLTSGVTSALISVWSQLWGDPGTLGPTVGRTGSRT